MEHIHNPAARFHLLRDTVKTLYPHLREILASFPIPIDIPEQPTDSDHFKVIDRARTLVTEQPVSEGTARHMSRVMLDWLTAYDQAAMIQECGPAPWRLDALSQTLNRIIERMEALDHHLEATEPDTE